MGDMGRKVVIDKNILGWGEAHRDELLGTYSEILEVGKHPDLSQRDFDSKIALYCLKNGCDLITADARAYTHFLDAGMKAVTIGRRDWDRKSDQKIYVVRVEE